MNGVLYSGLVIAQDGDWDHMNWDNGWWIVMVFGMVLFWALVIVAIVWLVRSLQGDPGPRGRGEPTAVELLDRRLAEGAISVEEYEERRRVLAGPSAQQGTG